MSDSIEMAQDGFERAHHHAHHGGGHAEGHEHGQPPPGMPRDTLMAAVFIAILAALAVIVEMGANDAQTAYLAHYVAAGDLWSEYQGKSVRKTVFTETAEVLGAQANPDPARIAAARAEAVRMQSGKGGMDELSARATAEETARDHDEVLHSHLEAGVRALQIAIVMLGLFLTTRARALLFIGGGLGLAGLVWSAACALGFSDE